MRKIFLLAVVILLLAGCGGKQTQNSTPYTIIAVDASSAECQQLLEKIDVGGCYFNELGENTFWITSMKEETEKGEIIREVWIYYNTPQGVTKQREKIIENGKRLVIVETSGKRKSSPDEFNPFDSKRE